MRHIRVGIGLAALLAQSLSLAAQSAAGEQEILELLGRQVEAWNSGDLEEFMTGYWKSPELTFFSGVNVTRGWQSTLQRYVRRYQSEGREMGRLRFLDLKPQLLGARAAYVTGRWQLTLSDGSRPGGLFSLILKRFPAGWRIVHDHTSP